MTIKKGVKLRWHLFRRGKGAKLWWHSRGCPCTFSNAEKKNGESSVFGIAGGCEYQWRKVAIKLQDNKVLYEEASDD